MLLFITGGVSPIFIYLVFSQFGYKTLVLWDDQIYNISDEEIYNIIKTFLEGFK